MRKHFKLIFILCLISSLARFALDSYLPSLPAIGQHFDISDARTQLTIVTLYLFGFSFSQLIYGPLSDHYGRRMILLAGLCIFASGTLLSALANSPGLLLFSRFMTGAGAGSCGVLSRAIASDCFKGAEFSKIWSFTITMLVVTLCIAPVLGGHIQEAWGWRANFLIATIFLTFVLVVIFLFLPETNNRNAATPARKLPDLKEIMQNYKVILATPSFLSSALCYTLAFSGLMAYFQVSPILFIKGLGLTPSAYGWCGFIIACNYVVGGLMVNLLADRLGTKRLLILGAFVLMTGGLLMLFFQAIFNMTITTILIPAATFVIGARIVIPNAIATSMEKLRHLNGSTSALVGFIQMMGSAVISLSISGFDNTSTLPLAIFLTVIGGVAVILALEKPAIDNQTSSQHHQELMVRNENSYKI